MIRDAHPATHIPDGGYVVQDTGVGDALAGSLNAAYRRESALPVEMMRLLTMLNDGHDVVRDGYHR